MVGFAVFELLGLGFVLLCDVSGGGIFYHGHLIYRTRDGRYLIRPQA